MSNRDPKHTPGLPLWAGMSLRPLLRGEEGKVLLDEMAELHERRRARLGRHAATRRLVREVATTWLRRAPLMPLRWLRRAGRGLTSRKRNGRFAAPLLPGRLDLRFSWRSLRRNRRLAIASILTLAVAVAATVAILTVTKKIVLDPLPYVHGERLAMIWSALPGAGYERAPLSGPEIDDLRRRSRSFEAFAAIWTTTAALVEDNRAETLRLGMVTANFLSLFGAEAVHGRAFEASDEGFGRPSRVMISESLWRRRFDGDAGILGRRLRLDGGWGFDGGLYTVVGIVPRSFELILPSDAGVATNLDLYTPLPFDVAAVERGQYFLRTLGRLAPGVDIDTAAAEIRDIGAAIASEHATYAQGGRAFDAVALKADTIGSSRPLLTALVIGVALLLLIAWSNVASLLLARALERRQEILMRTALGASERQIAGQLILESLLLALLGGTAGLLLGWLGVDLIVRLAPEGLPRLGEVGVDPVALIIALAFCLVCGLIFGQMPRLVARRFELGALRSEARAVKSGGRARDLLVMGQLALVFVLSLSALLCLETVRQIARQDLGFDAEGVLSFELTLPEERYGSEERLAALAQQIDESFLDIPSITAAGAINQLPLSELPNWSSPYRLLGTARAAREVDTALEADARVVTPGYFEAARLQRVEGRVFEARDDVSSHLVVVVDTLLAAKAWPGESAVGKELEIEVRRSGGFKTVTAEVIGVVEHVRHHDPRRAIREELYVPFAQGARNQMAVVLRTSGDPLSILGSVRARLAEIDAELALSRVRLLSDYVDDKSSLQRFTLSLTALFAALAILLAAVGLYGAISLLVGQRRKEIGLRLALGAPLARIAGLVLGRGLLLVLGGLGVGTVAALALGRYLENLLFEVSPRDPRLLVVLAAGLTLIGLLACWGPLRRALRVEPARVLRDE